MVGSDNLLPPGGHMSSQIMMGKSGKLNRIQIRASLSLSQVWLCSTKPLSYLPKTSDNQAYASKRICTDKRYTKPTNDMVTVTS